MGVEDAEGPREDSGGEAGGVLGGHTRVQGERASGNTGKVRRKDHEARGAEEVWGGPPRPRLPAPSLTSAYSALPFTSANKPPATATAPRQSAEAWPPRPRRGPAPAPQALRAREAGRAPPFFLTAQWPRLPASGGPGCGLRPIGAGAARPCLCWAEGAESPPPPPAPPERSGACSPGAGSQDKIKPREEEPGFYSAAHPKAMVARFSK